MKLPLSFPYVWILLVAIFCAFPYGRAVATQPGASGRIEASSAGMVTLEPSNKTAFADSSTGKRPGERNKAVAASKEQEEVGDREVMDRRNRMFILMLQILRAPK